MELKTIDTAALKSVFPVDDDARPEQCAEVEGARTVRRKIERRQFVTLRNARRAADQIGVLPAKGEIVHMLLAPNAFACFDVLPAMLELAGKPALEVVLLTLGINSRHLESLAQLAAEGRVSKVALVVSDYFRGTDREDFQIAAEVFRRQKGFRLAVGRTHCKVIALRFKDACYVASGSGNLRSSRNFENMDLHNDRKLFKFYADFAAAMLGGNR